VGYTGGTKPFPRYHSLGDHTETVQIDYDPQQISYGKLLELFFLWHSPGVRPWSRQYMSAIFYHDKDQQIAAESALSKQKKLASGEIFTKITALEKFYPAEDYHQKYYLKQEDSLLAEYREIYPDHADLVNSTAAARVNGYCGGFGRSERLSEEMELLGLSDRGKRILQRMVVPVLIKGDSCPFSAAEKTGTR